MFLGAGRSLKSVGPDCDCSAVDMSERKSNISSTTAASSTLSASALSAASLIFWRFLWSIWKMIGKLGLRFIVILGTKAE